LQKLVDRWVSTHDWSRYDVVGFTVNDQQLNASLALGRRIKDRHHAVQVVLGGVCMREPMGGAVLRRQVWLDAVFSGFAEHRFPWYVDALPHTLRQVLDGDSDPIILDEIPIPDYDSYFSALQTSGFDPRRDIEIHVSTTRGCWWGQKQACMFCGSPQKRVRFSRKSPARIYEELRSLERHHVPIMLADEMIYQRDFEDLLRHMRRDGYRYPHGLTAFIKSTLTRQELVVLREVGVTRLIPGIESLSTSILKRMRKGVTSAQTISLLRTADEEELGLNWNILVGCPGEDVRELDKMVQLLPLFSHLPAPLAAMPMMMLRFSPMHEERDELGLADVRPARQYALAFGDHPELECQAYVFDFRRTRDPDPVISAAPLMRAAARWNHLKALPLWLRCEVIRLGGWRIVVDTRRPDEVGWTGPRLRRLSRDEWQVLVSLHDPLRRAALSERSGLPMAELDPVLSRLLADRLVLELDGRLVRLVAIRTNRSAARLALRNLRAKVRVLRSRSPATAHVRRAFGSELARVRRWLVSHLAR
jgi:ribosomal peptide maturation radical SAM protein 1